tara:strand:+ start:607 stop:1683 length:1077 start_codon:yes stop_codon:yes gene_type:complete
MFLNKNLNCLKKSYIFFFLIVLFININICKAHSSNFKVEGVKITEPFNPNFKKEIVIDKAILIAFKKLLSMTIPSDEMYKIPNFDVDEIKNLIDSFNIKDEEFINNSYNATFEINFNKQNSFLFIEKKNIFPSLPVKKKIIIFPILVDTLSGNANIFYQNPFFANWNSNTEDFHLLDYILPSEDIDVIKTLNDNLENLENFDFSQIIKKYNFNEYIICLIYPQKDNMKVFSKIMFNNKFKINNKSFTYENIASLENVENLIRKIKLQYEDEWKKNNRINRSVKLPINLAMSSSEYKKNEDFENFLSSTDLVSNYSIKNFNNKEINYKIIFNGSPNQFLNIAANKNFLIDTKDQVWKVK